MDREIFEWRRATRMISAPQIRRRFRAYCVGAAKTGTTTIADMFRRNYRAAHEPAPAATNRIVIDALERRLVGTSLDQRVHERDAALKLELEAAHPLGYLCATLARIYPDARFIITIREPLSWLESRLNYHFQVHPPAWEEYRKYFWIDRHQGWSEDERPLQIYGLCSLDTYLQQYADHYERVLAEAPATRRLLLRTHELKHAPQRIAEFLDIPIRTLTISHSRESRSKIAPLAQMDPVFVRNRIWHHCQALIRDYFPETLGDYPR